MLFDNGVNGSDAGLVRVFGNALLSVKENSLASAMMMYPNPVAYNSIINLGKRYDNISMQVFSSYGQEIISTSYTNSENIQIDTSPFSSGIYMINLVADNEKATLKMIKR